MSKTIQTSMALLALIISQAAWSEPLYWKATKGDKEYLILGSVHMGIPEMYPMPETVMDYLTNSDGLITEITLSENANANLPLNSPILTQDAINKTQLKRLEDISIELGFTATSFIDRPAWQTAITLQLAQFAQLGFRQDLGIDLYFTQQAEQNGIPIIGLETMAFQLGLFTENDHISKMLLVDTVENWQQNKAMSQCLATSWQAGDVKQLEALSIESEISQSISEKFIYQRNRDWVKKLTSNTFLKDGRYLVVVGALHLIGEQNVISLLEKQGFQTHQLSKSERVDCP